MEEQRKKLILERGRIKSAVTTFQTAINNVLISGLNDEKSYIKLELKLNKIETKLDEFTRIHYEIASLTEDENHEELEIFEDTFYDAVASAKAILNQYNKIISEDEKTNSEKSDPCISNNSTENQMKHNIKLPVISLPKFDGKPEQWLDFRDIFQALVHNDTELDDAKKLFYLRGSLYGDAKILVQNIPTVAENYQTVWECLQQRYENKRLLIHNHLSAIYSIKFLKQENAKQLRDLLDTLNLHLRALETIGQPVSSWDTILIFILIKKLDSVTAREWECKQIQGDVPTMDEFKSFIKQRADMLETVGQKYNKENYTKYARPNFNKENSFEVRNHTKECYFCKQNHLIYYCNKFMKLNIESRIKEVEKLNLCKNCLRQGHTAERCFKEACKFCNDKHNSLLHINNESENNEPSMQVTSCHSNRDVNTSALLPTALVDLKNKGGNSITMRALLDAGSQINLITKKAAHDLGLKIYYNNSTIGGIGNCVTPILGTCDVKIFSTVSKYTTDLVCTVIDKISSKLPSIQVDVSKIKIPDNIKLADKNYSYPSKVDLLIGASHFFHLFSGKVLSQGYNQPVLAETHLGWVISGNVPYKLFNGKYKCNFTSDLSESMKKFWEIEEVDNIKHYSDDEQFAEVHFKNTTCRNSAGQFVVSIPFNDKISKLGDSRNGAEIRFLSLERKLENNEDLRKQYCKFIDEYISLGHMSIRKRPDLNRISYFLPHHCVINNSSITTKLRVVFDGSFKTTSGISRNEIESIGYIVQSDLLSILLRFRKHKIAITSDIVKMYRQIVMDEYDRYLQQILWRDDPSKPIDVYQLNTVTYGTASASFLATRCLIEVADYFQNTDPQLATVIRNDFYVDDVLTGADDIADAKSLCQRLSDGLKSFGFPLQKWNCNIPKIVPGVNNDKNNVEICCDYAKTLGIYWKPSDDTISFTIKFPSIDTNNVTKRVILSSISKIFDPLGLAGPCIIIPKIFIQRLWQIHSDWDSPAPKNIKKQWLQFYDQLPRLNNIKIPRCIYPSKSSAVELHGFADASQSAYGACVYLRYYENNMYFSNLICAKSKVAPLKSLTIPRLELNAAFVLSKLITKVLLSTNISFKNIYLWSDSEIVLCWLKRSPHTLKMFVANRVAKIQEQTAGCIWSYVSSGENPADLISRGLMPNEIINCKLWWNGPPWLNENHEKWQIYEPPSIIEPLPEMKSLKNNVLIMTTKNDFINFTRFSNYRRLLHTASYVLRFIKCCKEKTRIYRSFTTDDLITSRNLLIKIVQHECFNDEITSIKLKNKCPVKSNLINLAPILDEKGILRVSGRLQHSDLLYESKFPIILPKSHTFTELLMKYEHERLGHAGPALLLNSIRQQFWPIHGKSMSSKILHSCTKCFKAKPKNSVPLMGSLPAARVTPSPPFSVTGVDYAGPTLIKDRKGRGCKTSKAYFVIFICFATKAIHVEIATDLTTFTFISAFRRFVSRRGKPHTVWSDNGTNFVGAHHELKRIIEDLHASDKITETCSIENINWKWIPANSPHFGGLWESGVRSVKFHLKRVLGEQVLTYEELYSVTCQIEAIVNSRPLCVLSNHPKDLTCLTPGHFLIGRQITSLPDECVTDLPTNRLNKYQLIQQMVQHFWQRWASEYLHTLQTRWKWVKPSPSLQVGDVVLVQDDLKTTLNWPLGRIVEVHPGKDGVVRTATIQTSRSILRRSVHKLYRLPMDD